MEPIRPWLNLKGVGGEIFRSSYIIEAGNPDRLTPWTRPSTSSCWIWSKPLSRSGLDTLRCFLRGLTVSEGT